uniref:Uncharacterized protein n=1 Tax=Arundo donax TaxID=35708 RepID=A0A0A9CVM0_ARUDO
MLPFLWGKTFHFRGRRHRGEDHRPRHWRRRRWGRRLRLLRRHRGRLHIARSGQNSRLRLLLRMQGLLIHPLLHHHTRMPTELGHRCQKPQGRFCNPGLRPPHTGSKPESCRASYRNWIKNLRTGASSWTPAEPKPQEAAGNRGEQTEQVERSNPRSQI